MKLRQQTDSRPSKPSRCVDPDLSRADLERFFQLVGFPPRATEWWTRFYEPGEVALVLSLDQGHDPELSGGPPARHLETPADKAGLAKRAIKRGVLDRLPDGRLRAADFHARFEIWALFEGWMDVPLTVREALLEWEMAAFEERNQSLLNALARGGAVDPGWIRPRTVLLSEALALLDKVKHVYVWPCNCRSMSGRCSKPLLTCLRFSNDRDLGWEISRSRAREITREAHKKGLMHSAEVALLPDGEITGALCHCCHDCCFPHRLGAGGGLQGLYPEKRHQAVLAAEACSGCGACIKRCPAGAFEARDSTASNQRPVVFQAQKCLGCGLCVSTCPEGALSMIPARHHPDPAFESLLCP
jgi:NAD-dependent dihydropyrimidine dehydrogenase PreA subunit